MQFNLLENFLNTMGAIRFSFPTIDLFPPDDSVVLEMKEFIEESRQDLMREYEAICEMIRTNSSVLPFDCREFQILMISEMTKGYDPIYLNSIFNMRFDLSFYEDESLPYYFETTETMDIETMREMSAHDFILMIFNEMKYQAQKLENYTSERIFKREICQRHYFILFVLYCIMQSPLR